MCRAAIVSGVPERGKLASAAAMRTLAGFRVALGLSAWAAVDLPALAVGPE